MWVKMLCNYSHYFANTGGPRAMRDFLKDKAYMVPTPVGKYMIAHKVAKAIKGPSKRGGAPSE